MLDATDAKGQAEKVAHERELADDRRKFAQLRTRGLATPDGKSGGARSRVLDWCRRLQ